MRLNFPQCQTDAGYGAAYELKLDRLNLALVTMWEGKVPYSLRTHEEERVLVQHATSRTLMCSLTAG